MGVKEKAAYLPKSQQSVAELQKYVDRYSKSERSAYLRRG